MIQIFCSVQIEKRRHRIEKEFVYIKRTYDVAVQINLKCDENGNRNYHALPQMYTSISCFL